jgi:hypothetical protein
MGFPYTDTLVELRDVGRAGVVLDRASELDHALQLPASTPVQIVVVPSPSGQEFALEVSPAGYYSPFWEDVVVVDRKGAVLGTAKGLDGSVSWSFDSRALAYPEITANHVDIAMWTIGTNPVRKLGPTMSGALIGYAGFDCLWAPMSAAVLCAIHGDVGDHRTPWVVASERQRHVAIHAGPLQPLEWLPSSAVQKGGGYTVRGFSVERQALARPRR